jgi:prophage tail gpP-like protein
MPNPAETAVLSVNGRKYAAWTSFMLRRIYGGACSDFQFTAAEPLDTSTDFSDWRITPGNPCTITLAGILAFTGYVFVRQGAFDSEKKGLIVTGRSLTADAVDSSAAINGGQYKGYTFQAIASALAKDAGVNLVVKGNSPILSRPFPQFSIAYGETVFQAVERLARLRGLHITDDANGNWIADVFDPKAASGGQLVEGKNLHMARASIDGSRSFSIVNIVGQRPGDDHVNGDASRDVSATLNNPNARATRRSIVMMEEPGSPQDAVTRTNHEMAYNATDLVDCHCEVQGWQSVPGTLWDVGQNYSVKSPILDLDRQLSSRQVVYRQSEAGSVTEIDLCTPESLAFSTTPIGGSVQQGEPGFATDTPTQGALPDQPDN